MVCAAFGDAGNSRCGGRGFAWELWLDVTKARGKCAAKGRALRAFRYPGLTACANVCRPYGAVFFSGRDWIFECEFDLVWGFLLGDGEFAEAHLEAVLNLFVKAERGFSSARRLWRGCNRWRPEGVVTKPF